MGKKRKLSQKKKDAAEKRARREQIRGTKDGR